MPYSVKSFCNVKKDSRAHTFVFKLFINDVCDTMLLSMVKLFFLKPN
jgi:hypothetical protein